MSPARTLGALLALLPACLLVNDPDPSLLAPPPATCPPIEAAPAIRRPLARQSVGTVHAPETLRPEIVFSPIALATTLPVDYELELTSPSFPPVRARVRASDCAPGRPPGVWCHRVDLAELVPRTPPVGAEVSAVVRACCDGRCEGSPWSAPRRFSVGRPRQDLDGDGYADVAVAGQFGSGDGRAAVLVHFGGPGLFLDFNTGVPPALSPRIVLDLSAHHGALVWVGDFEGDGHPDLAVGGPTVAPVAQLSLVRGGPHLRDRVLPPTVAPAPSGRASRYAEALGAGDLDGDGCEDLAVLDGDASTTAGTLLVYRATRCCADRGPDCVPDPTPLLLAELAAAHVTETTGAPAIPVGDFDGDGLADVAFLGPGQRSRVLRGGHLTVYDIPADGALYPAAAGDLDGDGAEDLLTRRVGDDWAVLVHYGEPGLGLARVVGQHLTRGFGSNSGPVLTGGDLNGDGLDDLAVLNSGMFAEVRLGALDRTGLADIAATITPDPRAGECWSRSHPIGRWGSAGTLAGDLNGDGFGDLVIADLTIGLGFCLQECEVGRLDCPEDALQYCYAIMNGGFGVYFGAPGRNFAEYTTSCWWGQGRERFGGAVALP